MIKGKTVLILFILATALMLLAQLVNKSGKNRTISWDEFLDEVEAGNAVEVTIEGNAIKLLTKNQTIRETVLPPGEIEYLKLLRQKRVKTVVQEPSAGWVAIVAPLIIPLVFILLLFWGVKRMAEGIKGTATSFAKLGSRQVRPGDNKTTFADVAGADEAKADLLETVNYLKSPERYGKLGARAPKGVLLIGSPGTGKTLLARATAGEAGVSFFQISGSEFVEMFVGVGAARVRELFEHARKASPCIVFIDEIDAVGRARGAGLGQGNDEREQTLNQLLKEMDGFLKWPGIVILAATNRPDVLDTALLRPGRFDRHVVVTIPDSRAREAILRVHAKKIALAPSVDLSRVAKGLPFGMSGADIENTVNEAALGAARAQKDAADESDFSAARDRVLMGPARLSVKFSPEEKRVVAYHEAGHAIVAHYTAEADPVRHVTIVPRGLALGVTMMFPENDLHLKSEERLRAEIDVCFGGRAAEEMVIKSIFTGASNDLEKATKIARDMVMKYGMSDLGERVFGNESEMTFFGQDLGAGKNYSEATSQVIDEQVEKIISASRGRVNELLKERISKLHALAEVLCEKETIESEELKALLA
ncbi:ATP-dependent metallopeptidase FtsH/Yme1/Tma family protein [Candidatus Uhrbacteria bacterium]|nr:ATP-dependent metallopeptidase FtsH/Yme1/Tma family protein [Candidatus Uhrbacteria bacterium]